MTPEAAYKALETRFKRMNLVYDAIAMLDWDAAAMMPDGGANARDRSQPLRGGSVLGACRRLTAARRLARVGG